MEWQDLVGSSLGRPGMWVSRPYIDGLWTLWHGFSLGSEDHTFNWLCMWIQTERFPAPDGSKSTLAPNALLRREITGETSGPLTEAEDLRAVALLAELVSEFDALNE